MDIKDLNIEDLKALRDMIDETLSAIVKADVGISNVSNSSVTRTLVGALLSQLAMANTVLKMVYISLDIDEATNNNLDRLVSILGVYRTSATTCTGYVDFCKTDGANNDISIPEGTILVSKKDTKGNVVRFKTTEYAYLPKGETKVTVPVECVDPGHIILAMGALAYMESPIMGIEFVTNSIAIDGGIDKESDEALRKRAKLALSRIGSATNPGLKGALLDIDEVEDVNILDMNRGVGTTDISIMCASMPPTEDTKKKIADKVAKCKASGIDAKIIYPNINYLDITVTVQLIKDIKDKNLIDYTGIKEKVKEAIQKHITSLGIGDALIVNALKKDIMSCDADIYDILDISPSTNVQCTNTEVIRYRNITVNIDGEE